MGSVTLIISIVLIHSIFIVTSEGLEHWQTSSVCHQQKSRSISRYVPYIETFRKKIFIFWKTLTRYNYRWQWTTEWYTVAVCCPGYAEDEHSTCRPVCRGDCAHGLCIRPNECSCDVGYRLETDSSGQKCLPHCPLGCIRGNCTAPWTCTCKEGYELSDNLYTCVPSCRPLCDRNARCTATNKCSCNSGYEFRNVTNRYSADSPEMRCEPICSPECGEHSTCVEPNGCQCQNGYERVSDMTSPITLLPISELNECRPVCDPACGKNSHCVAPNVCECPSGFVPLDGDVRNCEPVCLPHCGQNGICIGPNQCECSGGYNLTQQRDEDTSTVVSIKCEPICDPPCGIRGDCIDPNTCSCEVGWKIKSSPEGFAKRCVPYCDPPCGPGSGCIKPNVCECYSGFEVSHNETKYFTCHPVCDPPCIHGTCDAPGVCTCDNGYALDTNNLTNCEPICGISGCTNGVCTSPNICTCLDGYRRNSAYSYVCDPVCTNCENGTCIRPNQCICNYGFEMNNNRCVPSCYGRCTNGTCIAPNKCSCDPGFKPNDQIPDLVFDSSSLILCQPFCEMECQNGTCTAPNTCTCLPGYEKNEKAECAPNCDNRCTFGNCVAPSQCACYQGYTEVDERNGEMCRPYCQGDCPNGQCISPGNCKCDEGYSLDIFNATLCLPVCETNCGNGECTGPNECQCYEGFVKEDGKDLVGQVEICVNPCPGGCGDHGICDSENRTCNCFHGWSGENCAIAMYCGIILYENDVDLFQWIPDWKDVNDTTGSLEAVKWQGPRCNEKCKPERGNSTNNCYHLLNDDKKYDNITGFVCFLSPASPCNAANLQLNNFVYSGIAGTIVVIIGIACTTAVVFLLAKRRRKLDGNGILGNDDNLLEQSVVTDSLMHNDESSYL